MNDSQLVDISCTVCAHSLNNPNFLICQHPVIPVAVCICCKESIDRRIQEIREHTTVSDDQDADLEAYCGWCKNGGDLFLCGEEGQDGSVNSCHHAFCNDCILSHLGAKYVQSIENSSSWTCFVCDSTPIKALTTAMLKCQYLSIYHESFANDVSVSFNCKEDKEAATDIARLQSVVGESELAAEMLDPDHINMKEEEIRDELLTSSMVINISELVQEEIEEYKILWKRQLDIMQRQEADLCDKVINHGYDLNHIYDIEGKCKRQEREMGAAEKIAYAAADSRITKMMTETKIAAKESAKMEREDWRWEEEIASFMHNMDDEARQDPIVQKYERRPLLKYPEEYRNQFPAGVMNALCYSFNDKERENLGKKFLVPPHVRIVLKYVRKEFPAGRTNNMLFADDNDDGIKLPQHVCKAFHYAEKHELPTLCDAYPKLNRDEICCSTNIGDLQFELEMCEATEQQLDEEHGLGQLFHNYTKCDDEDAHEIREERRCMYTTYYSSSSSSSLPDSATSSKIDDSSLPDQPQIQMELQLVPQQQQQLKRKYNDIEDPCPEADGKKKPPTPTTIEVIDLTGDSDDETDEVNEDLKIDPTNPEYYLDTSPLKPHQREGVRFMGENVIDNCSGCILAHSMGLGKSLTVISFIRTFFDHPISDPSPVVVDPHTTMMRTSSSTDVDAVSPAPPHQKTLRTALIVAPKNTLQNWVNEFEKWTPPNARSHIIKVFNIDSGTTSDSDRVKKLQQWYQKGGVMIIGYEMFRNMTYIDETKTKLLVVPGTTPTTSSTTSKKGKPDYGHEIRGYLVNPGPDLVIADEAHFIKNANSKTFTAMNSIRTKRRVALTGTPLQNNLREYYCMVNWVRDGFLGSQTKFNKLFVVPIVNGQSNNATEEDLQRMKYRAYVLHKKLKKIVDRVDMSQLTNELPAMRQFVVAVRMSDFQCYLYRQSLMTRSLNDGRMSLLETYQSLLRVWNHPYLTVMMTHSNERPTLADISKALAPQLNKRVDDAEVSLESAARIEDILRAIEQCGSSWGSENGSDSDSDSDDSQTTASNRTPVKGDDAPVVAKVESSSSLLHEAMEESVTTSTADMLSLGNKLIAFLSLLALSVTNGEKMILFSQSLKTLTLIELFLGAADWGEALLSTEHAIRSSPDMKEFSNWTLGREYLRIDGSTSIRQPIINAFNNSNSQVKLLLVSTKAGNMGINLQAASRVVLFDCSWNPAHDLQAIFRAYRYGQSRNVFVYRLMASGTMEEKIYRRQVNKQMLSARVIDNEMPDNNFSDSQTNQLMEFNEHNEPSGENQNAIIMTMLNHHGSTQDHVLRMLMEKTSGFQFPKLLVSIVDEGSLLEDNQDSHLTDQERAAAEEEITREIAAQRVTLESPAITQKIL